MHNQKIISCFSFLLSTLFLLSQSYLFAIEDNDLNPSLYLGSYCSKDVLFNDHEYFVLEQLEGFKPTTLEEINYLNDLFSCNIVDMCYTLNKMSGSQYSQLMITLESANHHFLRRLYDPLRPILAYYPSRADACDSELAPSIDYWLINNFGKQTIKSSHHYYGFHSSNYEIALGAQKQFNRTLTLGASLFYEYTDNRFKVGGSADGHTVLAGIYFAKSHRNYYVFADLLGGGTFATVKRTSLQDLRSNQNNLKSTQGAFYIEGGMNFNYYSFFLFQPFLGLELNGYHCNSFTERRKDFTALWVKDKTYGTIGSRLGLHFSTLPTVYELYVGLDLCWECLWNDSNCYRTISFKRFGDCFDINSSEVDPNAFYGSLNISKMVNNYFSVYMTGTLELNQYAHAYDLLIGIRSEW